jgi:hypothetical protein
MMPSGQIAGKQEVETPHPRGDVRLDEPITSKTTPIGRELDAALPEMVPSVHEDWRPPGSMLSPAEHRGEPAYGAANDQVGDDCQNGGNNQRFAQEHSAVGMHDILNRFWGNLLGRASGLMNFRLVFQPLVAGVLAIRAGLRDARAGRTVALWTAITNPARRHELLRQVSHVAARFRKVKPNRERGAVSAIAPKLVCFSVSRHAGRL